MSKIDRNCENCGDLFQATSWEVNRGNGRYCSRACSATVREKLRRGEGDLMSEGREQADWNRFKDLDYQEDY